jgi:FkbM family methyltransferase
MTIDSLAAHFRAPDVLKIDAEGAELQVLEGAAEVLKRFWPVLLCDLGPDC